METAMSIFNRQKGWKRGKNMLLMALTGSENRAERRNSFDDDIKKRLEKAVVM